MNRKAVVTFGLLVTAAFAVPGADRPAGASGDHEHGSATHVEEEVARGPHGGRLLTDGDFALEIMIHEAGASPELRVYPFEGGRPLDPEKVTLGILLHRFGERIDEVGFRRREDYLLGAREVEEPHSFAVEVEATHAGRTHRWRYESWEGRTEIPPEAAEASGIELETAEAATIRSRLRLHGRIVPNEEHLARVAARYGGVVQEARRRIGERVNRGDVLAVVESNESLRAYEIRSPIAGTVLDRDLTRGEFVDGDHTVYVVGDLSTVWLDLLVRPEDARWLAVGQEVMLGNGVQSVPGRQQPAEGEEGMTGRLVHVSPLGSERTQRILARAELPNRDGRLRPGLFTAAEVVIEEAEVPVAVRREALQTFRDWDVVYLHDGRVFQAMPVEIGRRDREWVEIRSGVEAGQRYAARGSFIVKADVGKSGAAHEH